MTNQLINTEWKFIPVVAINPIKFEYHFGKKKGHSIYHTKAPNDLIHIPIFSKWKFEIISEDKILIIFDNNEQKEIKIKLINKSVKVYNNSKKTTIILNKMIYFSEIIFEKESDFPFSDYNPRHIDFLGYPIKN